MSEDGASSALVVPELIDAADGAGVERALVWRAPARLRVASTSLVGGGVGWCSWYVNATVGARYARLDPDVHLSELAASYGLDGPGVAMMTAADVRRVRVGAEDGVSAMATVGLGWPTWAADAVDVGPPAWRADTVNIFVVVPERCSDAALVNLVATATEAKVQALGDLGVDGTGTASDAVAVASFEGGRADPFGGPRSRWGARAARVVYGLVRDGALEDEAAARAAGYARGERVPGRRSPWASLS